MPIFTLVSAVIAVVALSGYAAGLFPSLAECNVIRREK